MRKSKSTLIKSFFCGLGLTIFFGLLITTSQESLARFGANKPNRVSFTNLVNNSINKQPYNDDVDLNDTSRNDNTLLDDSLVVKTNNEKQLLTQPFKPFFDDLFTNQDLNDQIQIENQPIQEDGFNKISDNSNLNHNQPVFDTRPTTFDLSFQNNLLNQSLIDIDSNSEKKSVIFNKYFIVENDVLIGLTDEGKQQTTLTIPASVREIGQGAFKNCEKLEKVVFSDQPNLEIIGDQAFANCLSLNSITIPKSVNRIGSGVFFQCKKLTSDNVKNHSPVLFDWWVDNHQYDGKTMRQMPTIDLSLSNFDEFSIVGVSAFSSCSSLESINISNKIKRIDQNAFWFVCSLKEVTFEENSILEIVNYSAFAHCTCLKKITIPNSVKVIGKWAFYGCKELNCVDFLFDSLTTTIGDNAFSGCTGLATVNLDKLNRLKTIGANAFSGCTSLTSIVIPGLVSEIGENAFGGCTSLKTVRFAGNIGIGGISIGKGAFPIPSEGKIEFYFISQDSLNNVCDQIDLPDDKREYFVDVKSFFDISDQGVLTVKGDRNNLKQYLRSKGGVLDISALKNVKVINDAFRGYNDLKNVILPTSLTTISADSFKDCTSLATVNLGQLDKLTTIGANAFGGCTALTSATIPANVTAVADNAFATNTTITNNTTTLFNAYVNSKGKVNVFNTPKLNLALVDGGKYVKIADNAFANLEKIEKVIIPGKINYIGANAFSGCTSLKEVTFMGTKTITLGSNVFMKDKVEKFLFEDKALLDALKGKSDAGIDSGKCSLITSGLSDGAIVGITFATIFASICLVVGIVVPIRKWKMNALNHQDISQTKSNN